MMTSGLIRMTLFGSIVGFAAGVSITVSLL